MGMNIFYMLIYAESPYMFGPLHYFGKILDPRWGDYHVPCTSKQSKIWEENIWPLCILRGLDGRGHY